MLRLPHTEFAALLEPIKRAVIRFEQRTVADIALSYAVFRSEADTPDLAFYDTDGTIYIPEHLMQFDQQYAHLVVLHEQVEIQHKRAARPHAYAHRRALLAEFLMAKRMFSQPSQLERYLHWRLGGYPESKGLDRGAVLTQLRDILAAERLRKGELFQVIKAHGL
jgi:hypothetical protein